VHSVQDAYYKAEDKRPAITEVDSSWQPAPPPAVTGSASEDRQAILDRLYAERDRLLKSLDEVNAEIYRLLGQQ
jgi:hypothetical protein